MKVLFVVNPVSGGVDKEPFLNEARKLCESFGLNYEIFKTSGESDAEKLKERIHEFDPERIFSVGGDGTSRFTALTILDYNIPMGIIPQGSANGMAKELNIPINPVDALKEHLISRVIKEMDMIKINDEHYCIHLADVGINAQLVDNYEKDEGRGMLTYAKYFTKVLTESESFDIEIDSDEETKKVSGFMCAICNGRNYGTGIPLNLISDPFDGKFEISIYKSINAGHLIKAGLAKFNDRFLENINAEHISAKKVNIKFSRPKLLQVDGEIIGKFESLKLEIVPSAIQLVSKN